MREREKFGARFSIVVVAEGAVPIGGNVSLIAKGDAATAERLGGLSATCARQLEALTGKEARYVVLGHLQRGGIPTAMDRLLATRFGVAAVDLIAEGKFGHMVGLRSDDIVAIPLTDAIARYRGVEIDHNLVRTARGLGICFGD